MKEIDHLIRDAEELVGSLTDERANWRPKPGVWSVTENLDHLTISTRRMTKAMNEAVEQPGAPRGNDPWRPSLFARLFVWVLEPPVRVIRVKTPTEFVPKPDRPKHVSLGEFTAAHRDFATHVANEWVGFDLNRVTVVSPFNANAKYSLGTAIAIVPAHGRRHIWQARQLLR